MPAGESHYTTLFRFATGSDWVFGHVLCRAYASGTRPGARSISQWQRPFRVDGTAVALRATAAHGILGSLPPACPRCGRVVAMNARRVEAIVAVALVQYPRDPAPSVGGRDSTATSPRRRLSRRRCGYGRQKRRAAPPQRSALRQAPDQTQTSRTCRP